MIGTEIGAFGSLGLLVLVLVFLGVLLYLVPIPLWIAAWASGAYGRDRNTARATLGRGLAVSAFPLYVPV